MSAPLPHHAAAVLCDGISRPHQCLLDLRKCRAANCPATQKISSCQAGTSDACNRPYGRRLVACGFAIRDARGPVRTKAKDPVITTGPSCGLGPAATPAVSTGRTRDRTRPMLQKRQKVLARAPSTRDPEQKQCQPYPLAFVWGFGRPAART